MSFEKCSVFQTFRNQDFYAFRLSLSFSSISEKTGVGWLVYSYLRQTASVNNVKILVHLVEHKEVDLRIRFYATVLTILSDESLAPTISSLHFLYYQRFYFSNFYSKIVLYQQKGTL